MRRAGAIVGSPRDGRGGGCGEGSAGGGQRAALAHSQNALWHAAGTMRSERDALKVGQKTEQAAAREIAALSERVFADAKQQSSQREQAARAASQVPKGPTTCTNTCSKVRAPFGPPAATWAARERTGRHPPPRRRSLIHTATVPRAAAARHGWRAGKQRRVRGRHGRRQGAAQRLLRHRNGLRRLRAVRGAAAQQHLVSSERPADPPACWTGGGCRSEPAILVMVRACAQARGRPRQAPAGQGRAPLHAGHRHHAALPGACLPAGCCSARGARRDQTHRRSSQGRAVEGGQRTARWFGGVQVMYTDPAKDLDVSEMLDRTGLLESGITAVRGSKRGGARRLPVGCGGAARHHAPRLSLWCVARRARRSSAWCWSTTAWTPPRASASWCWTWAPTLGAPCALRHGRGAPHGTVLTR